MDKSTKKSTPDKDDIWKDPRFSHLVNDPRFKQLPQHKRKVKIDKRFESMFNDSKFKVKYTVDKYGRRVDQTSSENLKKFYEIESSDEDDEDDEENEERERREEEKEISKVDSGDEKLVNDNDLLNDDGEKLSKEVKNKLIGSGLDYARGEGRILTDSSSDDESSGEEDDNEVFIEHVWGELDNDAPRTDESTNRLAACNMDWDRIRASDIMVLCNSFLPPGGGVLSVTIYPSEFGKKRMEEEELHGPPELVKKDEENDNGSYTEDSDSDDDELVKEQDSDAEEGDEYHMEKLRQYQLNRLKYYYAVIECDSVSTADKLYKECDGIEYESTSTKLDLRFIPDDVTFDEDEPKDVCTEIPDVSKYKPRLFTTTALQQARVELTWDEMSIDRKELGEKLSSGKINEISAADLRKYVAYSSEDEEDESDDNKNKSKASKETETDSDEGDTKEGKRSKDAISKYKSLLEEINKKEDEQNQKKFEVEFSWNINAAESKLEKEKENDGKDKTNMTPIEKFLEKKREKNKKRKQEKRKKKLKGAGGSSNDEEDDYSSDDLPDDIDLNDSYFAEEFANGDFEPPKHSKSQKDKKKSKSGKNRNEEISDDDIDQKATKELELLLDDDDDGKQHFSLKKIQDAETETKSKRKRMKKLKKSKQEIEAAKKTEIEDNFKVNIDDDRFKAIFTSHLFNIDPSDPHFKKTKGMEEIIQTKLKRRYDNTSQGGQGAETQAETESKRPKQKIENSILAKSIKRKIAGKHF